MNQRNDQLPIGSLAQLIEHCTRGSWVQIPYMEGHLLTKKIRGEGEGRGKGGAGEGRGGGKGGAGEGRGGGKGGGRVEGRGRGIWL